MSLSETPTPAATTRWTPGGTPHSSVYGDKAYLPPETFRDSPRVQASDKSMQKWLQHEDEDFVIKRRWEPRVGT
jgi:tRNA U34 5-methylaminomethyl-2-thiouridine-forming methyltransferase MnmC